MIRQIYEHLFLLIDKNWLEDIRDDKTKAHDKYKQTTTKENKEKKTKYMSENKTNIENRNRSKKKTKSSLIHSISQAIGQLNKRVPSKHKNLSYINLSRSSMQRSQHILFKPVFSSFNPLIRLYSVPFIGTKLIKGNNS